MRQIGTDEYTCIAPPGYERDPAILAAIHEFDPGVIPFWRRQLWEDGGETFVTVHHGIARYYPFPRQLRAHIPFAMPANPTHEVPNFLDAVFEDQNAVEFFRGGPGGFIPWDWRVYYWCRRKFERITVKAYNLRLEQRIAREEAIRKAHFEEIEYRKRQIEPFLLRQAERVTEAEWKQLREAQHRNEIRKRMGLRPEPLRQPKTFVHVRSPRTESTYGRVAPSQE